MIGVLLVLVAITLAIEMKSLLLGEAASVDAVHRIEGALAGASGVERIIHMKTLHLGPEEILVAAKIAVGTSASAGEVADIINRAEDQHPHRRADGHRALPRTRHLRRTHVPAARPSAPGGTQPLTYLPPTGGFERCVRIARCTPVTSGVQREERTQRSKPTVLA